MTDGLSGSGFFVQGSGRELAHAPGVSHLIQHPVPFVGPIKKRLTTSESHQEGGVGNESPFFAFHCFCAVLMGENIRYRLEQVQQAT